MKGFNLRHFPLRISKIKQGEEKLISVNKMQGNIFSCPLHTVPLDYYVFRGFSQPQCSPGVNIQYKYP